MSQIVDFLTSAWNDAPLIVQVLVVLLAGWVAAMFARSLTQGILAIFRFDRLADRVGLAEFLRNGQVTLRPAKLVGVIVYRVVILITLLVASRVLNIAALNAITDSLVTVLPGLVAAIFVIVVGLVVVSFLANVLRTIARNTSMTNVRLVVKIFRYAGYAVLLLLASDQLGLGKSPLSAILLITFGAFALAFAIAFGLGSVDLARKVMENLFKKLDKQDRGAFKETDLEDPEKKTKD